MHKPSLRHLTAAVTATVMALSSAAAFAQGHGPDRHDDRRGGPPGHARGHDDRRGPPPGHAQRGAGPDHNFYKGARLPQSYRSHQYVVDDWRGHRLSAPPRGYHWVQTGSDYLLVAIATGVIAQVLLNN